MAKNIQLVTRGWSKEVTIILHEHATLTGEARAQINARKKRYVRFLEGSFAEAVRRRTDPPGGPEGRGVRVPRAWCCGSTSGSSRTARSRRTSSVREMQELFFGGLESRRPRRSRAREGREAKG